MQRFPFDKIKIDRSFVKEVTRDSSSASIIRAVVSIAADRNMVTTAEGVETLQQREIVQSLGCTQSGLSVQRGAPGAGDPGAAGIQEGRRRGRGVRPKTKCFRPLAAAPRKSPSVEIRDSNSPE